jgi:putative SOS response-associated peptidase YedK
MCYKFILAGNLAVVEKKFNVRAGIRLEWEPHFVVSPGDETLVITQQNPGQLTLSKFGLVPSWSKQSVALINARAEGNKNPGNDPLFTGGKSIFMKPAFKRPLVSQRCVVIADAFIEWSVQTKQPYLVYLRDKARPFGMAGVYDIWINPVTKAETHSFAVITVPANALIGQLPASRMPVILPRGRERDWLRSSNHLIDILGMLEIYPAEKMNAYPLGRELESADPHTPEVLKPAGERIYQETGNPGAEGRNGLKIRNYPRY